jgi:HEPN domain-containing protein
VAIPADPDARRYYRAASQRLEDARFILEVGRRSTAAVYLAGYCVEFLLKALILSQIRPNRRSAVAAKLRTHSTELLRKIYEDECRGTIPKAVARDLSRMMAWDSQLRYEPGTIKIDVAADFVAAVKRIWEWGDERL